MIYGKSGYSSDQDSQRTIRASKRRSSKTVRERIRLGIARPDTPTSTSISHVNAQGTLNGSESVQGEQTQHSVEALQQIVRSPENDTIGSATVDTSSIDGTSMLPSSSSNTSTFFERLRQNMAFDGPSASKMSRSGTIRPQPRIPSSTTNVTKTHSKKETPPSKLSSAGGPMLIQSTQITKNAGQAQAPVVSRSSNPSSVLPTPYQAPKPPSNRPMNPAVFEASNSSQVSQRVCPARAPCVHEKQAPRPSPVMASGKENKPTGLQVTEFSGIPGLPQMQTGSQPCWTANQRLVIFPEQRYNIHWDTNEKVLLWKGVLMLYDTSVDEKMRSDEPYLCVTNIDFGSFGPSRIRSSETEYGNEFTIMYNSRKASKDSDPTKEIVTAPWIKTFNGWYKAFTVPLHVNMFKNRESRVFLGKAQATFMSNNKVVKLVSRVMPSVVEILHRDREMIFHSTI